MTLTWGSPYPLKRNLRQQASERRVATAAGAQKTRAKGNRREIGQRDPLQRRQWMLCGIIHHERNMPRLAAPRH